MTEAQKFNIAAKAILRVQDKVFVFKCRVPNYLGELVDIWSLPGGKLDAGESEIEAMVRELKEEIGYELDLKTAKIHLGGYYIDLDTLPGKLPICFLHLVVDIAEEFAPRQTEDFIDYKWVDWEEFFDLPLHLKKVKFREISNAENL